NESSSLLDTDRAPPRRGPTIYAGRGLRRGCLPTRVRWRGVSSRPDARMSLKYYVNSKDKLRGGVCRSWFRCMSKRGSITLWRVARQVERCSKPLTLQPGLTKVGNPPGSADSDCLSGGRLRGNSSRAPLAA